MTTEREVPEGWRILPFAEIAENINERVDDPSSSGLDHYVGLEHLDPDTLKISRWGSPTDVEATKLRFYPGDVIYARRRAYQRKLGVAEWDGIASAHSLVLRARPDVCLPEFLPYFLQSDQFHQRALDISVGSLSPTINWRTLAVQEFTIPPLKEQHEVVDLQGSVLALEEALTSLRRAGDSLGEALRSGLGDVDRLVPLSDVANVVDCEHKTAPLEGGANYLVGTPDFRDGALSFDGPRWVSDEVFKEWTRRAIPRRGDVLLARQAPIGDVALVPDSPPVCLGQQVVLIQPIAGDWVGLLLYHWLRGRTAQAAIARASGGSAHPHLNMKAIRALQVPDPGRVDRSLIEKLTRLTEMVDRSKATSSNLAALRRRLREHELGLVA